MTRSATTFEQAAADTLRANVDKLPTSRRQFASDLLARMGGGLSDKQWLWVGKLAEMAITPAPEAVQVGSFAGVIELFTAAKVAHPKIRLQLADGRPIVLSLAGPNSRQPGTVTVTDGRPYGSNVWYGRVSTAGGWERGGRLDDDTAAAVAKLLSDLAADPAGVAAAYGKLTGGCCFCKKTLTVAASKEVGYGPDCAKRYGLPWGGKSNVVPFTRAA